jgi:hypothetical protein
MFVHRGKILGDGREQVAVTGTREKVRYMGTGAKIMDCRRPRGRHLYR